LVFGKGKIVTVIFPEKGRNKREGVEELTTTAMTMNSNKQQQQMHISEQKPTIGERLRTEAVEPEWSSIGTDEC
jgi:hypothetical protein